MRKHATLHCTAQKHICTCIHYTHSLSYSVEFKIQKQQIKLLLNKISAKQKLQNWQCGWYFEQNCETMCSAKHTLAHSLCTQHVPSFVQLCIQTAGFLFVFIVYFAGCVLSCLFVLFSLSYFAAFAQFHSCGFRCRQNSIKR